MGIPIFVSMAEPPTPLGKGISESGPIGRWVLPFSEFLNYPAFTLSVTEMELPTLADRLRKLSPKTMDRLRVNMDMVYSRHFSGVKQRVDTVLRILRANHCGYQIPAFPDPCQPDFLLNYSHIIPA